MTSPEAIDPPGCGCTDCITGWSIPLDQASSEDVFAMATGAVKDRTGLAYTMKTVVLFTFENGYVITTANWDRNRSKS